MSSQKRWTAPWRARRARSKTRGRSRWRSIGVGEEHLGGGLGVVAEDVDLGDLDLGGDVGGGEQGPLVLEGAVDAPKVGEEEAKVGGVVVVDHEVVAAALAAEEHIAGVVDGRAKALALEELDVDRGERHGDHDTPASRGVATRGGSYIAVHGGLRARAFAHVAPAGGGPKYRGSEGSPGRGSGRIVRRWRSMPRSWRQCLG
jgi:hypothetical protein